MKFVKNKSKYVTLILYLSFKAEKILFNKNEIKIMKVKSEF